MISQNLSVPGVSLARLVALTLALSAGSVHAQKPFFAEASPLQTLAMRRGTTEYSCVMNTDDTCFFTYTPEEVMTPHDRHKLTIFLPMVSAPADGYPVIMYSPASSFTGPQPRDNAHALLTGALDNGWAVVTVGTVGVDSDPTGAQLPTCCDNMGCVSGMTACRDYNIFYPPGSDEWNDFNLFFGEKDFVWARQYIAHRADDFTLNNDRIVVTGTSSGAHYAAFLALNDNLAWSTMYVDEESYARSNTQVAGLIMCEPVAWFEGAFWRDQALYGAHWLQEDTTGFAVDHIQRAHTPGDAAVGDLHDSSTSVRVRAATHQVPMFIASGDNNTTGFARDVDDDYCRVGQTSPCPSLSQSFDADPILDFDSTLAQPMNLHDSWNAIILMQDLLAADEPFHTANSRLYLRDDTNWENIPEGYHVGSPDEVTGPEDVEFIEGDYCDACSSPSCDAAGTVCASIGNFDIGATMTTWLADTFCTGCDATVSFRNGGTNPAVYSATELILGKPFTLTIDTNSTPWTTAGVLGYGAPVTMTLTNGQVLLMDLTQPELLMLAAAVEGPSGVFTHEATVPQVPAFCGLHVYSQAVLFGGMAPWGLSNAQDLVVGGQ